MSSANAQKVITKKTTTIKQNVSKSPKKKKNRSSRRPQQSSGKDCYARILNDPFNTPPCRLGFGTMVPTQLGSCNYRSSVFASSDGCFSLAAFPFVGSAVPAVAYNNGTLNTNTWTSANWSNIAAYPSTIATECRCVGLGIRVTPLVAATAAPGICYAGQISGMSKNDITSLSHFQLYSYASLQSFVTNNATLKANSRPLDNQAYEMLLVNFQGSTSFVPANSVPVVTITGFPASAVLLLECTYSFEYIPAASITNAREIDRDTESTYDKISRYFTSTEEMWEYTVPRLDPSATIDTLTAGLNLYNSYRINNMLGGQFNGANRRRLN